MTRALAMLLLCGTAHAYVDGPLSHGQRREVVRESDHVLVVHPRTGARVKASIGREALVQGSEQAIVAAGLVPVRCVVESLHIWQVRGRDDEDGLDVAERLARTRPDGIEQAIPDLALPHRTLGSTFTPPPNDPRYGGQWFFDDLGMNAAWAVETGSAAPTVVVIDDGCDLSHPDLVDQLDPGTDVFSMDDDPSYLPNVAENNHGTSCAGLVAARTNNGVGVAGACPGCRLRCVRLLGKNGDPIPLSADLAAFQFAYDNKAAVVSNSWGYVGEVAVPDMLRQLLEQLYDSGRDGLGSVVVFAAGNDARELGDDEINAVRGVVTVGAVDNFGELTAYSNHGACVSIVSPTGTLTTDISGADGQDPGDYTSSFSGTSSACPIVAGVLGLLASAQPTQTSAQLVSALLRTAKQSPFATPNASGHDDSYGQGQLVPLDALRLANGDVLDAGSPDATMAGPMKASGCGCDVGAATRTPFIAIVLCLLVLLKIKKAPRLNRGPLQPR